MPCDRINNQAISRKKRPPEYARLTLGVLVLEKVEINSKMNSTLLRWAGLKIIETGKEVYQFSMALNYRGDVTWLFAREIDATFNDCIFYLYSTNY